MPTNQTTTILKSIIGETNLLPCSYRIISMVNMYNLLGSKSRTMGYYTRDYELCEGDELYNSGDYAIIKDSDIAARILNAFPGDLIICKILLNETCPYYEYAVRRVVATTYGGEEASDSNGLHVAY